MSFKEMIAVMFACILANNYVFRNFFGVEALDGDAKGSAKSLLSMGLTVTGVLVVSTLITWPLESVIASSASYLQTLVYAVVTTMVVYCVDFCAKKFCKCEKCNCLPIAVNSIVLGCCLTNAANGYGFGLSLLCAFGASIAYLVASFMVAGVRERVNEKFVPDAWKGAPILVLEMAIISLVVFAF